MEQNPGHIVFKGSCNASHPATRSHRGTTDTSSDYTAYSTADLTPGKPPDYAAHPKDTSGTHHTAAQSSNYAARSEANHASDPNPCRAASQPSGDTTREAARPSPGALSGRYPQRTSFKEQRVDQPSDLPESHIRRLTRNHKLNMQEQYKQQEVLHSKPLHVAIPTGDRCNLRCIFCTDRSPATKYVDLTFEQFLRFTEPLEYASMVQLYGWGEPFANPEYERMFDYVAEHYAGTRIYISTNGTLLTEQWVEKILSYGKCLINVSLNAATRETYVRLTQADLFQRVIDNVNRLVRARAERDVRDLVLSLSFVAIRPNIHELADFVALSDKLGIRYVVLQDLSILEERHWELFLENDEEKARQSFLAAAEEARSRGVYLDSFTHYPVTYFSQERSDYAQLELPRDCLPVWEQDGDTLFYPQPGECYEPYQTFLISQNGAVTTCCRAREVMGNLVEQSFDEVWNGEVYRYYRRTINTFRPPQACVSCPVKMGCDVR
jgi:radical SAM protein with 4Fe4S-binding SPASM domain